MRSLFVKMFLWIWLANIVLTSGIGVVFALSTSYRERFRAEADQKALRAGQELLRAWDTGGAQALAAERARIRAWQGIDADLYRSDAASLSGEPTASDVSALVPVALRARTIQIAPARGRTGMWHVVPMRDDYFAAALVQPPTLAYRYLNPQALSIHLSATFLVAGAVSFALARFLTSPIRKLRIATQQVAQGDLSTRVEPEIASRYGEISALAADFDQMAARIEALIDAQKRLLRDISHELRSPLARLNVALELARQSAGPDATKPLDRIEREAERLNDLIGQMLTLTVLESGAERLESAEIDLVALVREVVADADFEAKSRGRSVRLVGAPGPEGTLTVRGASELLRRAIENVVRNSIRHTPEGAGIEVQVARAESVANAADTPARAMVGIRVRDHGPGVPPQALEDIFKPFYRVVDARDRQSGGTGIGLAITDRAIRLHGGTVTASNAPDGGLIVELKLPLA